MRQKFQMALLKSSARCGFSAVGEGLARSASVKTATTVTTRLCVNRLSSCCNSCGTHDVNKVI